MSDIFDRPPITQAFLLCAGLGTRMMPLTAHWPKPLLPLFHEPLLFHTMRRYCHSGIDHFIINTHHLHEQWDRIFPKNHWDDATVTLSHEPVLLDSGGGLINALSHIDTSSSLLVHNGDVITSLDHEKLIRHHRKSKAPITLALRSNGILNNVGFDEQSGLVTDMRNSLGVSEGTHEFAGIYCIEPELIKELPEGEPASIVPLFLDLIKEGKVEGIVLDDGYWYNVGDLETYRQMHRDLLSEQYATPIHPSATIDHSSKVCEHTILCENSQVRENCTLKDCIVFPEVTIPESTNASNRIFFA